MPRLFQNIGALKPQRSTFDLSHTRKFDGFFGVLYPVLVEDCLPGDVWRMGNSVVCRFHQSLFAPLLHEVNIFVHYFFVPYRILWEQDKIHLSHPAEEEEVFTSWPGSWEQFISKGKSGDLELALPKASFSPSTHVGTGGRYDFIYGVCSQDGSGFSGLPAETRPIVFPSAAYTRIWNEYYRDENLEPPINSEGEPLDRTKWADAPYATLPNGLHLRAWAKDYFTSALPWPQRGTPPALPATLAGNIEFTGPEDFLANDTLGDIVNPVQDDFVVNIPVNNMRGSLVWDSGVTQDGVLHHVNRWGSVSQGNLSFKTWLEQNTLMAGSALGFNINDLRSAFQLQKWMERNARAGVRFIELLKAHFGTFPTDERLDRPEYIGGSFAPVIFSEVLQTSQGTAQSPQGNMAGHGIAINGSFIAKYHVKEHGCLIGLLSVMPKAEYQNGLERMWTRNTAEEFYWPEFAHLGEQAILNQEVSLRDAISDSSMPDEDKNSGIFGFQGRYDEYRYRKSTVHGDLRSDSYQSLDFWHLARSFGSKDSYKLNSQFLHINQDEVQRIFPVVDNAGMLFSVGNNVKVSRPLPFMGEPGLLDHF